MKKARRRFRRRNGKTPPPPKSPAKPAASAPDTPALQDVDVVAIEAKIMGQLTPTNRANVERVVVAGMKAALNGGENSIAAGIAASKDPLRDCAIGAVNLAMMLRKQSRDTMPPEALVPGAMILMLHALDFADRTGAIEVGKAEIDKATRIFTNHLFNVFKITPDKLNAYGKQVSGIAQDPGQMDAIARRAGVVKDPGASVMTALPEGLISGGGNGV